MLRAARLTVEQLTYAQRDLYILNRDFKICKIDDADVNRKCK